MKLLQDYEANCQDIFDYFGYVYDWVVIPLNDCTDYFWRLNENTDGSGSVRYADEEIDLDNEDGNYYEDSIYTQRFLPKWVYRGQDYTMVCADTHTDGNKFLQIFDNTKERN